MIFVLEVSLFHGQMARVAASYNTIWAVKKRTVFIGLGR